MGTTVFCIGNTLMGDDGVGAAVARELDGRLDGDVHVVVEAQAGMGLYDRFVQAERVIVVDAIDAGSPPGSVFRFSPDEAGVTELRSNNIHGMGVGFLMTTARLAGYSPDVTVYGIQVGDVRPNPDMLSDAVREAVTDVARMIVADASPA